jgi:hypothetical protein
MDFGEAIFVWRRRRQLTAALVLLGLTGIAAALAWLPRNYQATASVVLLPSQASSRANGGNPYLSFTSAITQTADLVGREVMSAQTAQRLAGRGLAGSYTVALDPDSSAGSVLDVAVSGSDPAGLERTLHAVIGQVPVALTRIQSRVRPEYRIRAATVTADPRATLAVTHTARPIVGIAVILLLGAFGVPLIVDGRLRRRRPARQAVAPIRAEDPVRQLVPAEIRPAEIRSADEPVQVRGGPVHRAWRQ